MRVLFQFVRWIGLFFVLIFLFWQAFVFVRPAQRTLSDGEVRAVRAAVAAFREDLAAQLGQRAVRLGVVSLTGEGAAQATVELRGVLERQSDWRVDTRSVPQAFVEDVLKALRDASTLEQVLGAGKQVELDVVVAGRMVSAWMRDDGRAEVVMDLYAYDTQAGVWLLRKSYPMSWAPDWVERVPLEVVGAAWWQRLVLWASIVLVLPWLTPFIARWARERRSNAASALALSFYVVVSLLLAGALMGFALSGLSDWLLLVAALVLSGGYAFWACERIAAK